MITSQNGSTTVATGATSTNSSISDGVVVAIVLVLLILTASIFAVFLGFIVILRKRKTSSQAIVKDQCNGEGVGMSLFIHYYNMWFQISLTTQLLKLEH